MIAIAATNDQWLLTKDGQPAFLIKEEREIFREITRDKVVVYDYETLGTLPRKQPLANRCNIIITNDRSIRIPDAITVTGTEELKHVLKSYQSDKVYLIGGPKIFAELIDECSEAQLSIVHQEVDLSKGKCEFFPNLDKLSNWGKGRTSSEHFQNGIVWHLQRYINFNYRTHSPVKPN